MFSLVQRKMLKIKSSFYNNKNICSIVDVAEQKKKKENISKEESGKC